MKHILEQALVALLNENPQDAEKLFHQFIDRKVKEINEGAGTFSDGEDEVMVIDGAVGEIEFIFPEGGQYGYSEGNSTGVDEYGNEQITVYISDKLTYVTIEDCSDLQTDQESLKAYFAGGDQIDNTTDDTGFDMSDYAESVEPNLGEAPESDYDALDNDDWDDVNSDDDEFNLYGRGGDLEEAVTPKISAKMLERLERQFDAEIMAMSVRPNVEQTVSRADMLQAVKDAIESNWIYNAELPPNVIDYWADNIFDSVCNICTHNYEITITDDVTGGDLEESFKLAQVTAAKGDGREQGDSKFKQNSVSPVSGKRGDVSKLTANPVKIKSEKVSGYDKESSPSVVTNKVPMAKQTVVKK